MMVQQAHKELAWDSERRRILRRHSRHLCRRSCRGHGCPDGAEDVAHMAHGRAGEREAADAVRAAVNGDWLRTPRTEEAARGRQVAEACAMDDISKGKNGGAIVR